MPPPLLLRQGGIDVQHERVAVCSKFGNDEWHPLSHEAADEGHVVGQAAEFRHHHRNLCLPRRPQGSAERGSAIERIRVAGQGHSMEAEARRILQSALKDKVRNSTPSLYNRIHARFAAIGGVDLKLPPREPGREPPIFG